MAKQCATCVFAKRPDGRWLNPDLAELVERRMMSCSQICHHPQLKGKPETHLCRARGTARSRSFTGSALAEATDAAWEAKRRELGV
jgi:hypothetical protein